MTTKKYEAIVDLILTNRVEANFKEGLLDIKRKSKAKTGRRASDGSVYMKPNITPTGHLYHSVSHKGKVYAVYHHEVMAVIGGLDVLDKDVKMVVNHKDGNKTNNRIENLEVCTQAENMQHAYSPDIRARLWKHQKYNRPLDID